MRFSALNRDQCSYCTSLLSRYPCELCCGIQAEATWSGSLSRPGDEGRLEGGIFMQGSRWVCMLREVAASLPVANPSAGISAAPPSGPPPDASDMNTLALTEAEVLAQLDLPEARTLVSAYDL